MTPSPVSSPTSLLTWVITRNTTRWVSCISLDVVSFLPFRIAVSPSKRSKGIVSLMWLPGSPGWQHDRNINSYLLDLLSALLLLLELDEVELDAELEEEDEGLLLCLRLS
jgi:hypothetical protein